MNVSSQKYVKSTSRRSAWLTAIYFGAIFGAMLLSHWWLS